MNEKIGVYICECGPNISDKIDIDKLIRSLYYSCENVVIDRYKLLCSPDGKEFLKERIKEEGLTHLVVGACSPKQHESTFMKVCEDVGLNPYLFQIINIREQCAWITENKDDATEKAERLMLAGIKRVRRQIPLEKKEIERNPDVLVIGAGIAGIEASRMLASEIRKVYLIEKSSKTGGKVKHFNRVFPGMQDGSQLVNEMVEVIHSNDNIVTFKDAEVERIRGFFGNFVVEVRQRDDTEEIAPFNVGAIVVAIGTGTYDPANDPRYGYGKIENVITANDLEEMNYRGEITQWMENCKSVGIVHCVGRETTNYCSEVCCIYSLKHNVILRELSPDLDVAHFCSDLCLPQKNDQDLYGMCLGKNVEFIRSSVDEVRERNGKISVIYRNARGEEKEKILDKIILASSMIPSKDTEELARLLNISVGKDGYFQEGHAKLGCVTSSVEGIFIAGCAHAPMGISKSLEEADAVAGRILSSLVPGKMSISPEIAVVDKDKCIACLTCVRICPYMVPEIGEEGVAVIQPALCKGCGTCVGECPAKAIQLQNYTDDQIMAQCDGILLEVKN